MYLYVTSTIDSLRIGLAHFLFIKINICMVMCCLNIPTSSNQTNMCPKKNCFNFFFFVNIFVIAWTLVF